MNTEGETCIHQIESVVERLDLERMFPKAQPLEVELGSGDGSFLAKYANLQRDTNFIGVERLLGRLRKLDRKSLKLGLRNIRIIRIEASYFLEHLLPRASVTALHIYFPDPWPKRKHRKHRLINLDFPSLAQKVLRDQGVIYLRTDDADYFGAMKNAFAKADYFQEIPTPDELAAVVTDFERSFLARGVQANRAAYRLIKRQ